jgi:transposase
MSSLQLINAVPYIAEKGCKRRAPAKTYGNRHATCFEMNRWNKSGVLKRLFEALQTQGLIRIKMEVLCIDSTSVKVARTGREL